MVHRKPSVSKSADSYSRVRDVSASTPVSQTTSGNVKVCVRVRPENSAEAESSRNAVIRVLDEHVLIFDPKEESSPDFYRGKRRVGRDLNKKKKRDVRFAFDRVFDHTANNQNVYDQTTSLALDGLLDGYNCSVFAYGATGAGKTFTMLGNYQNPGVVFLTMMDLYKRIENVKEEKTCDVAVSYLEVYNEQIRDLLVPGKFLPIREDAQKGVVISGLSLHKPDNAEELLHMLDFGNRNRTQHPTDANAESSRSHAVFQVFVRQKDRTANISANVRVAKMSLIDLAGSERATVTTNRGARFREGANINKSLLALGNCINALAEGKSKGYVPYRNSKLTRLLKDSLGGNCRTVMIAAISPSALSYEDTYNTLNYANRAKNIKADLKRNVLNVDFHISQYAKIVDELRLEVTELKGKLKLYEDGSVLVPNQTVLTPAANPNADRLKGELVVVFEDRRNIRKEIMELEGSDRDLALKIHSKSRSLNRVQTISTDLTISKKITDRITHSMESARRRQNKICQRKLKIQSRMDDNESRLQRIQSEVTAIEKESLVSELLESQMRNHHLEIELLDTKRHVKCLKKLCRFEESQAKNTENIVTSLLQAYRKVFFILKGHGIATSDTISEFEAIQHLVEGEREVAWADQSMANPDDSRLTGQSILEGNSANEDSFDINQILTFPVLSTVNLLTHTPRRSGSWTPKTPCLGSKFEGTPISCMKNQSATPLQPWSLNRQMPNNNTPVVSGSSAKGPSVTSSAVPPVRKCLNASPPGSENTKAADTPPGFQVCGPPNLQIHSVTRSISNEQTKGQGLESHHSANVSSCLRKPNNLHTNAVVSSGAANSTFTSDPLEGIVPLSSAAANTTLVLERPSVLCTTDTPVAPVLSSRTLNTTITVTPPLPPRIPLMSTTLTKSSRGDAQGSASVHHDNPPTVNNGTVTKSSRPQPSAGSPHVSAQDRGRGTITKPPQRSRINTGTVTKHKTGSDNDENTPPDAVNRSNVVRSMDFADDPFPSPAGKLTFAEVLKSPGAALSKHVSHPAPRSPLASRENIPTLNKHGRGREIDSEIPLKQRKVRFSSKDNPEKQERPDKKRHNTFGYDNKRLTSSTSSLRSRSAMRKDDIKSRDALHKLGMTSVWDMKNNAVGSKPKYMQLTRSASMKRSGHRRSLSAEGAKRDTALPRRVPIVDGDIPQRTVRSLFHAKSKSTTQLPKR